DVAAEFAEAKLSYLASASLLEHIDIINLSEPQRQLLAGIDDLTVREMVRDFITAQQFRRDIFVKGGSQLSPLEGPAVWRAQRFALSTLRADVPMKVSGLQGEATLQPDIYKPILDALEAGPRTLEELLALPATGALGGPSLQQALSVLIGANHAQPCLNAAGDTKRAKGARAFNTALMNRAKDRGDLVFLASPVTGGGLLVPRFDQLFLFARRQKQPNPPQFVWEVMSLQGQKLIRDGKTLETAEENLAQLRIEYEAFVAKRLSVLTQLGID
ncbi:MAG: methyltransferase regulatory domain-containing protein, partial [Caulobacteraceae bacterium]